MFKEYDVVTLLEDVSQGDEAAKAGEIGTIVHMYPGIDAFTVEFNHGVLYECDLLDLRRNQVRHAITEDFEREKRELAEKARAAGRTHNFRLFNFVMLTEDVTAGDAIIKAGALGSIEEVYAEAILVEFKRGAGELVSIVVQPHQARLATTEEIDAERRQGKQAGTTQPVAD
ncbi:MAG: DUF4926 domain-containing protein [Chloroflexota bacterium]|nr:DUF4926 domain-containing protein [Chloroflexota bacterium]